MTKGAFMELGHRRIPHKLGALVVAGALVLGCALGQPVPTSAGDSQEARDTLARFLEVSRTRDFEGTWRLLSGPLRERYTPQRLSEDFDAVALLAQEKLERARLALDQPPVIEGRSARFPIGPSKAVRLTREADGWKIEALE